MEVNNKRIKQMNSSALQSELSLESSMDHVVQQVLYSPSTPYFALESCCCY